MFALFTGMCTMGFILAGMFFLRFWRRTRDALFATFAAAFFLLALNQFLIGMPTLSREDQSLLYLPRLIAFALLIVAIVVKNTARSPADRG